MVRFSPAGAGGGPANYADVKWGADKEVLPQENPSETQCTEFAHTKSAGADWLKVDWKCQALALLSGFCADVAGCMCAGAVRGWGRQGGGCLHANVNM